jgi:hypothetical protein
MTLKTKLSLGLGFLFLIIFALDLFSSFYIQKLANESKNILKDNYDSITYAKKMFYSLDDMNMSMMAAVLDRRADFDSKRFDLGKEEFDRNLKAESNNITEIHEKEYVAALSSDYALFLAICPEMTDPRANGEQVHREYLSAFENVRQSISDIEDINMQAVSRKNQATIADSNNIANVMALIGAFFIVLALGYIWYFPFYISNSISYLAGKMRDLLSRLKIPSEMKTKDETFVILQGLDLIKTKFNLDDKNPENVS